MAMALFKHAEAQPGCAYKKGCVIVYPIHLPDVRNMGRKASFKTGIKEKVKKKYVLVRIQKEKKEEMKTNAPLGSLEKAKERGKGRSLRDLFPLFFSLFCSLLCHTFSSFSAFDVAKITF